MKSSNHQENREKQNVQDMTKGPQKNESIPAQKDGFRYDFNDSSEFNDGIK